MENPEFLLNCFIAFAIVFLVLSVLSLSIRLLTSIFPQNISDDDAAYIAAIDSHLSRVYPHSHITKIEEQR
jgi:hypothetical protein